MLPDQPWLVKCPHCEALIWIDEQKQVGEIEPWGAGDQDAAKFSDACPYVIPSIHDYLASLARGVSDEQKKHYLRLRVWWAGNDERRQGAGDTPMSSEEADNLCAFVMLLDEAEENDCLMKAEAMRELGRFAEARVLLSNPFSAELSQAVAIITGLTEQEMTSVVEMKFT
jgi:hypothetical protein